MTNDQLFKEARAHEHRDRLTIGDADADLIAQGEICRICGARLASRQGTPTLCTDCGGDTPPWRPRPSGLALVRGSGASSFHAHQQPLDDRSSRHSLRVLGDHERVRRAA